jgi:hypothetical protein
MRIGRNSGALMLAVLLIAGCGSETPDASAEPTTSDEQLESRGPTTSDERHEPEEPTTAVEEDQPDDDPVDGTLEPAEDAIEVVDQGRYRIKMRSMTFDMDLVEGAAWSWPQAETGDVLGKVAEIAIDGENDGTSTVLVMIPDRVALDAATDVRPWVRGSVSPLDQLQAEAEAGGLFTVESREEETRSGLHAQRARIRSDHDESVALLIADTDEGDTGLWLSLRGHDLEGGADGHATDLDVWLVRIKDRWLVFGANLLEEHQDLAEELVSSVARA